MVEYIEREQKRAKFFRTKLNEAKEILDSITNECYIAYINTIMEYLSNDKIVEDEASNYLMRFKNIEPDNEELRYKGGWKKYLGASKRYHCEYYYNYYDDPDKCHQFCLICGIEYFWRNKNHGLQTKPSKRNSRS